MRKKGGVHDKGSFSLADMLESARSQPGFSKAGAMAIFVGVVRGETLKGERVQKLQLEAYEEKADEVLQKICNDLMEKPGITDVQIHHLLGEFTVGDDLIYVMVAGSHRGQVFPVLEQAVERYKKEAPIFKKEFIVTAKGIRRMYWSAE